MGIAFYDVDVGPLNYLFTRCDISTVTTGKPHRGLYSTPSKNGWHRISLSVPSKHLAPVFAAAWAADFSTKWIPPAREINLLSALSAEVNSGKQQGTTHRATPLHSLKNSQAAHCNPGEGTQSSLWTPSTKLSILPNSFFCCLSVIEGCRVTTSFGTLAFTK